MYIYIPEYIYIGSEGVHRPFFFFFFLPALGRPSLPLSTVLSDGRAAPPAARQRAALWHLPGPSDHDQPQRPPKPLRPGRVRGSRNSRSTPPLDGVKCVRGGTLGTGGTRGGVRGVGGRRTTRDRDRRAVNDPTSGDP